MGYTGNGLAMDEYWRRRNEEQHRKLNPQLYPPHVERSPKSRTPFRFYVFMGGIFGVLVLVSKVISALS